MSGDEVEARSLWGAAFTSLEPTATIKPDASRSVQALRELWDDEELNSPVREGVELLPPPFRLEEKIAEGGMGEIWIARQERLDRQVAVKRLKDAILRGDMDNAAKRWSELSFRQEALTLASLEHPNIIPVHDLGEDDRGEPLLVMKHVRGETWNSWIQRDFYLLGVAEFLEKHLRTLVDVSQAVAFAHSKGVLHRDLKPDQVMIGAYGEVLLMDWGLAAAYGERLARGRAEQSDSLLYFPVNPAGTPAFMAPEQTTKESDGLGPWTDVYLLGGILYYLVSGAIPHAALTSLQSFKMAANGHYEPPSTRTERAVPEALERLVEEAMRPDHRLRLQSAELFIERLEDYLSGANSRRRARAIVDDARKSLLDREGDYESLSKAVVELERASLIWPSEADTIALREELLRRHAEAALGNGDLRLARAQAERMAPSEERGRVLALVAAGEEEQRRQAETLARARAVAEMQLARGERLVHFLLDELCGALKPFGRLSVLRKAASEAFSFFDAFAESDASPGAMENRARAFLVIGEALENEGKRPDALEAFEKGREFAEKVVALYPASPGAAELLAGALRRLGALQAELGDVERGLGTLSRALELHRAARPEAPPATPRAATELALCLRAIGAIHLHRQDLAPAIENLRAASDALASPVADRAAELARRETRAAIRATLSNALRDFGDLPDALALARETLAEWERLLVEQPANHHFLDRMLWAKGALAYLLFNLGEFDESLSLIEAELRERVRMAADDPENLAWERAISFGRCLKGQALRALGRRDEAVSTLREEWEYCLRVKDRDQGPRIQAAIAFAAGLLAMASVDSDDDAPARLALDVGREAAEKALLVHPENLFYRKSAALCGWERAKRFCRDGRRDEALAELRAAKERLAGVNLASDILLREMAGSIDATLAENSG